MPMRPAIHRPITSRPREQQRRQYDTERGTAAQRGYGHRWQKARATFLARQPLCRMCAKAGKVRAATVVDHIIPHKGDQTVFWDTSNWQSLCAHHHSREKQREEARGHG